jgi:putative ABC transport system ATP-binding protein
MRKQAPAEPVTIPAAAVVEVRNVAKRYGDASTDLQALSGIDLSVRPGEFVALIGPSGSGKSTLLHLIGAIDRPSEGEILVDGVSLADLSARDTADYRNRKIGFVFQMLNLVPSLTVEENLWLPSAIAGMSRGWVTQRIDELLGAVGIADKRKRYPQELSGGEQQRVALARAMLMQPAVLLADEPTGSLDAESSRQVTDLLLKLHDQGQIIILATHDPRVASLADRVVYLRDGRIEQELDLVADSKHAPKELDRIMAIHRAEPV